MIEPHFSVEPLLDQPESCTESQNCEDKVDPRLDPLEQPEAVSRLVGEVVGEKPVSRQALLKWLRP